MVGYIGPTESYLSPDPDAMRRGFEFWFLRSLVGLVELGWRDAVSGSLNLFRRFDVSDMEEMISFIVETNSVPGNAMYWRPALIRENATKFISDSDFVQSPGCWVDLDEPGAADRAPSVYSFCRPNMVVVTGRKPHKRVQMFWRLEDMEKDPARLRRWNTGVATLLGGDTAVINPTTLMRIPGTIAWPWKEGREVERTELVLPDDDRPKFYMPEMLDRVFTQAQAKQEEQPRAPDEATDIFGRLNIEAALKIIRGTPHKWHEYTLWLVNNLVARGMPDALILALAAHITIPPYTVDQTTRDLAGMIRTGRQKFNIPNQDDEFDEAETAPPDDGPFTAFSLTGTPPPREWLVPGWLPRRTVTSLYGDGGIGKSLLAQQLAVCMATGQRWLGLDVTPGRVLAIFCEDDHDELWRRQADIEASLGVVLRHPLDNLLLWPRVGFDNLLVQFDMAGSTKLLPFFNRVTEEIKKTAPTLLMLDTAADLFGGNEIVRAQVNYFIKSVLGKFVVENDLTVLLLAHPSAAGIASGRGDGASTHWNNAVRSRWYIEKVKDGLPEQRFLTRKKANYSASGDDQRIDFVWERGAFALPTSGDTVSRLERRAVKRDVFTEVDRAWCDKAPYTGHQGSRPVKRSLPRAVPNHLPAEVMKAFFELCEEGCITTDHGNSHRRGYCAVRQPDFMKVHGNNTTAHD